MRVRKYRVWDVVNKKWADNVAIITATGKLCDIGDSFWNILDEKNYIIQESINLNDAQGKEIYEGDILKVDADNENPGVVKWSRNCCYLLMKRLMNSKQTAAKQLDKGSTKFWTVIGNILETPEYLE